LEFETLQQGYLPPVIHSQHHQLRIGDPVLGIFYALNLIVLPVLQSDQWLWYCRHKYQQFSEFEIL